MRSNINQILFAIISVLPIYFLNSCSYFWISMHSYFYDVLLTLCFYFHTFFVIIRYRIVGHRYTAYLIFSWFWFLHARAHTHTPTWTLCIALMKTRIIVYGKINAGTIQVHVMYCLYILRLYTPKWKTSV